jgi:hypothetical protein
MNKSVKFLLFEAYRRNEMRDSHENSKPLNKRWLGLGTAAAYKPALEAGLMTFHNGRTPPPRCMGWLTLTDAGIEEMKKSQREFSAVMQDLHKKTKYDESYQAHYVLAGGFTR